MTLSQAKTVTNLFTILSMQATGIKLKWESTRNSINILFFLYLAIYLYFSSILRTFDSMDACLLVCNTNKKGNSAEFQSGDADSLKIIEDNEIYSFKSYMYVWNDFSHNEREY
jgi:hypothetical protein